MSSDEKGAVSVSDSLGARNILVQSIQSLFLNNEYSDITVSCEGNRWPCHRAIVCPRSKFFASACKKEWQKGEVAEIPLEDDEPHVIEEMLRYLYTGQDNDEVSGPGVAAFPPLLLHVHLHTVGDKYDIPDLCSVAEEKFVANAGDKWDTTEFAEAIAEMYETSPYTKTVLHKTVVEVASKHAKELYTNDAGQRFREVASETPKFMSELFSTLVIKQDLAGNDEARYACLDCQRTIVMEKMEGNRRYRCHYPGCSSNSYAGRMGQEWKML